MFGFGKKNKKEIKSQEIEQKIEVEEVEVVQEIVEEQKEISQSWLSKLSKGLGKSSSKINEGMKDIFVRQKLDDETLEQLEDLLITADLGVKTASYICGELAKDKFDKEITAEEVKIYLANIIEEILKPYAVPLEITNDNKPQIILMAGVNGTGKTTTIGKLCNYYKSQDKKIMLAACDTFRAAAVEQLNVWSKRTGFEIITGKPQADPASVAFEACTKAKEQNMDALIIDTAGRLQNKAGLMEQLAKLVRVIKKHDENAPHNCIIVLDATTGQNANSQVREFKKLINVSGIIVTKLDGTAKGGVIVGLAKEFNIPIHAIGVGEAIDDLRPFDAKSFAQSLVGIDA